MKNPFIKIKIVKDEKREKELEGMLSEARSNNIELIDKITAQETIEDALMNTTNVIIKERDELREMVREQTEADLLINSLRAVGIIPEKIEETEKKHDAFAEDYRLRAMQQRSATMNTPLRTNGILTGMLGGVVRYI